MSSSHAGQLHLAGYERWTYANKYPRNKEEGEREDTDSQSSRYSSLGSTEGEEDLLSDLDEELVSTNADFVPSPPPSYRNDRLSDYHTTDYRSTDDEEDVPEWRRYDDSGWKTWITEDANRSEEEDLPQDQGGDSDFDN